MFVGPRPLVRKVLDMAFRFRGPHELHPICAGRELIGEGIERCDPRDRCFRGSRGVHRWGWHAGCVLPTYGKLEWGLLGSMPCGCGLPTRRVLLVEGLNCAERQGRPCVRPQYSAFKQEPIIKDTRVLESAAERCDGCSGEEGVRVRPERHEKCGLVSWHGQTLGGGAAAGGPLPDKQLRASHDHEFGAWAHGSYKYPYFLSYGPLEPAIPVYTRNHLGAGAGAYGAMWSALGAGRCWAC